MATVFSETKQMSTLPIASTEHNGPNYIYPQLEKSTTVLASQHFPNPSPTETLLQKPQLVIDQSQMLTARQTTDWDPLQAYFCK